jgi:hypothetical protein
MLGMEDIHLRRKMQEFMRRQETEVSCILNANGTNTSFTRACSVQVLDKASKLEEVGWREYGN